MCYNMHLGMYVPMKLMRSVPCSDNSTWGASVAFFVLYDNGRQGLEAYPMYIPKFVFHSAFLCQLHAHIYVHIGRGSLLFSNFLTMKMFVRSQSFISVPSFMFVSAAVREIRTCI